MISLEGWSSTIELHPQIILKFLVEGGGFEPPKAEPSDLQSDPFGHSGTPPISKRAIIYDKLLHVNNKIAKRVKSS